MKQEKFNSLMVAIVAISAVFGFVSIVWATFNQTLTITGYDATVEPSKWEIKFGTIATPQKTGTATFVTPTGSGTVTIDDFEVTLKTPGDSVEFTVPIENHGTYNAQIQSVTLPTVGTMTSDADSDAAKTSDVNGLAGKVTVEFTYWDAISHSALSVGDPLPAAVAGTPGSRTVKMKVTLDPNLQPSELPVGNVTVPITATTIVYEQA